MKVLLKVFPILLIAVFISSCGNQYSGYQKTETGLYYKFHTDIDGIQPVPGQILSIHLSYGTSDTIIFNNRKRSPQPVDIMLMESMFEGDLNEGLAMMTKGDSASFIVDAESFFTYIAQSQLPGFIEPGSSLFFDIVMVDFMDEEEFVAEQQRIAEELMERSEEFAQQEADLLDEYILKENIKSKPLESGLIYIELKKGSGEPVKPGKIVRVHYEGRLIDGTVFDSSDQAGRPLEFVVGRGQVISGWDEGILLMNVGGEAQLIIPSYLAYGQRGFQNLIPPFSSLIFDVEVVEMK